MALEHVNIILQYGRNMKYAILRFIVIKMYKLVNTQLCNIHIYILNILLMFIYLHSVFSSFKLNMMYYIFYDAII